MPQASDEARELMTKWFGGLEDYHPLQLLLSHGYTHEGGWLYKPTDAHTIHEIEWACISFLVNEWDYALDVV